MNRHINESGKGALRGLLSLAFIIIVIAVIASAASKGNTGGTSSTTTPTPDTSISLPTADTSTSAPATAAPAPTTIFSLSGSGIKNTADFNAPSEWTLNYTFDCSNFGQAGNFQVSTMNADGSSDNNGPTVNELASRGGSSTQGHSDSGSKYLQINSECSWTVSVVG